MKNKTYWQYFAAALLALATQPVLAQTPGAVGQVDSAQQRHSLEQSAQLKFDQGDSAPELYSGESEDVGTQSVLKIKPQRQWISGTLDSQLFYSDNVFLQRNHPTESAVLASTAQLAVAPTAYALGNSLLSPRVGYRAQWFDYFQIRSHNPNLNTYDFNAQTAFADLTWQQDNWIAGIGFDYTRLLQTSDYDEFYAEYAPRWGVARVFPLCPKSNLMVAYKGAYHFTDAPQFGLVSDFNNRLDEGLEISYTAQPCTHVIVQPYYRFKYSHFTGSVNRNDYLHSLGVGVYYYFCDQFSARGFVNYDIRQSNISLAEYSMLDAGAGLNFTFTF